MDRGWANGRERKNWKAVEKDGGRKKEKKKGKGKVENLHFLERT